MLDNGSCISLISEMFTRKSNFPLCGWDSSRMSVVTGATFSLQWAVEVEVQLLSLVLRGRCSVLGGFPYDILLEVISYGLLRCFWILRNFYISVQVFLRFWSVL